MVEHQPCLLGSRVRFPAGAFAIFFRFCQSFTSNFSFRLSLPLSFPSSSFPFLFLSLRPFVCALKSHSSHLSHNRQFRKWRTSSYRLGGQHTKWIMGRSAIFKMADRSTINLYASGGSSVIYEIVYRGKKMIMKT